MSRAGRDTGYGSLNPARAFGPAIVGHHFGDLGKWLLVYVLSPGVGGLAAAVVGPVSTTAGNFSVTAGTGSFTGGQLAIGTAFNMGGPDAVTGADGQVKGLIFGHSDYLASIVYLPTQMGNTLAGLSSTLSFTWSAEQRVGIAR